MHRFYFLTRFDIEGIQHYNTDDHLDSYVHKRWLRQLHSSDDPIRTMCSIK